MPRTYSVKEVKPFNWLIRDRTSKACTMEIRLEYDVIDRRFNGDYRRRYSKVSPWQKWRAAKPDEIDIGKEAIGPRALAACVAASISPTIWQRASKAAATRQADTHAADAVGYMKDAWNAMHP
ncbi:hypothetical protein PMI07_000851 [Rhizobium sp. CF080]|uniref:hypothetical protein n=1 Tax=Rhizobium sp. (strain CF080) TaxID=1144310 RepID=UPI000271ACE1|nr:hypothetical protein [Rhizobium sp. CF080]EUB97275.1 hypothetical protein PMI07_000851 [Rhizobium sp. CF080]